MMEEIVIKANRREIVGKRTKGLRREGILPAVIYGRHVETQPLSMDHKETSQILEGLSPSALIVLQVDGEQHYVLVREKQRDVISGSLLHVDFQDVLLTEKTRANVTIHLTGVSPAVRDMGGILVQNLEQLDVEALPRDLPEYIEVDISGLEEIGDAIYVRDLHLMGEVDVLADPDDVIVVVTMPEAEVEVEEEEEVEEEILEGTEPEVIERGKREEEGESEEE